MTSKCGRNKKVAHEPLNERAIAFFLPPFDVFYDLLLTHGNMESI